MSINPVTDMDVDSPAGLLKRCSSAPTINDSNSAMTTSPSNNPPPREQPMMNLFASVVQPRTRRFSASFSPLSASPSSGLRTPRINQLRQEEWADTSNNRELAHEREIHHTMQISQSWEDLRLVADSSSNDAKPSKMSPLHVTLPASSGFISNSPSPTHLSSGFQSPTRYRFVRRSASPVLRPSPLGVKRKLDDDKQDFSYSPRAKRFYSCSSTDRGGLLATTTSSLPGSLSSVGTPESLSSADSPGFNFRLIDSPSPNRPPPPEPMVVTKSDQDMTEESPS